jgi:hypothetical protein
LTIFLFQFFESIHEDLLLVDTRELELFRANCWRFCPKARFL